VRSVGDDLSFVDEHHPVGQRDRRGPVSDDACVISADQTE